MSKNMTVYNNLENNIANNPNAVILNMAGDKVNSLEFLDNINTTAKSIKMLGTTKDQPITVIDDTTEAFIYLFYASNKFGSIFATPGFPLFCDKPIDFTDKIGSETLFISKRFYEMLEQNSSTRGLVSKLGLKNIIILPTDLSAYRNLKYNDSLKDILNKNIKLYKNIDYLDYTDLMDQSERAQTTFDINNQGDKKDMAYLFTSGSTGTSKTLRMSNASFVNMSKKIEDNEYNFIPGEDVYFASLPCNFVTPLETLNFFLQLGIECYVEPLRDFSKITDIYYRSGATIIMCPPSLLDPLHVMVTKSNKTKINFIKEMIKNAPKDKKVTTAEKIAQLKMIKKMFENRPNVKYIFSAGEPLTNRLEKAYKDDNIQILNCTGSAETGPTAINGVSLPGDMYRIIDPISLNPIYSSDKPDLTFKARGLLENKKSSSSFNGYLNNEEMINECYNIDNGIEYWKYYDIAEVNNGILKTLCRAVDAIITDNKIIVPSDLTTKILKDPRILKCEAYPVTINEENRMVIDIVINMRYKNLFHEIILQAHKNIYDELGEDYLPFGYKDNNDFGASLHTGKLDRDAIRKNRNNYISPIDFSEIKITEIYNSITKVLKNY